MQSDSNKGVLKMAKILEGPRKKQRDSIFGKFEMTMSFIKLKGVLQSFSNLSLSQRK